MHDRLINLPSGDDFVSRTAHNAAQDLANEILKALYAGYNIRSIIDDVES